MADENKGHEPLTHEQEHKIHSPVQKWSDEFALKVSVQDFLSAAMFRTANHDWRWRNADEIYLAWQQQRMWPGSKAPRSSLSVFLAFQQIESLLPSIVGSLFGDMPAFFMADPLPGTSPEEARLVREAMIAQMRTLTGEDGVHPGMREQHRRVIKNILVYGNGQGELGWLFKEFEKLRYGVEYVPEFTNVNLPGIGVVPIPTGNIRREVREEAVTETINQPFFKNISLKDFYIDPNTAGPSVQEGRFAAKRARLSVDELDGMREVEGFKIPSRDDLIELSRNRPGTQGETTKQQTESIRGNTYNPQADTSVDPSAKTIEVLGYWTQDRHVWTLNRKVVAFNQVNPYGFIPYFNGVYADVPDRFYGLAVTDVVEGDQRLIAGLLNSHIDEVSLSINPQRRKRRGVQIPSYAMAIRPGAVQEFDDPEKDLVIDFPQGVTQNVFTDIALAERRTEKYTAAADIGVVGVGAGRFGNSAARTATGVNTQTQAAGLRIAYVIENYEGTVVEPMLNGWHKLNNLFLPTDSDMQIQNTQGQPESIDTVKVKNAQAKFVLRAASKLRSKTSMAQSFPGIAQILLNPAILDLLARQQGKTININEITNMILDTINYRPREGMFRDLTEQEQAQLNQPAPEEALREKMQRDRLASQESEGDENRQADFIKDVVINFLQEREQQGQQEA